MKEPNKISTDKTKLMAFWAKIHVRFRIVLSNKTLQQF